MKHKITNINQLDLNQYYTYADYLNWQFDDMVELIRGKIFRMSPAPNRQHQEASTNLVFAIKQFLQAKACKVYHAPFDVRLPLPPSQQSATKIDTVVQPDICVICDFSKLDEQGCNGAPDWIIEILSPATSKKDLTEKFDIYQHAGVKEYWVVHPSEGTVIPYRLDGNNIYTTIRNTPFAKGEHVPVGIFDGFAIDLEVIFEGI
jgi:Uma2 family endonuclease